MASWLSVGYRTDKRKNINKKQNNDIITTSNGTINHDYYVRPFRYWNNYLCLLLLIHIVSGKTSSMPILIIFYIGANRDRGGVKQSTSFLLFMKHASVPVFFPNDQGKHLSNAKEGNYPFYSLNIWVVNPLRASWEKLNIDRTWSYSVENIKSISILMD